MKKYFILALSALAVLVSCEKEIMIQEEVPVEEEIVVPSSVTFNAILTETRTELGVKDGDTWPNYWSNGDVISVNGTNSEALVAGSPTKQASFTVGGVSAPYHAAYPASAISGYSDGSATVTIPTAQNYVEDSYDPAAYVMLGYNASSTDISFAPAVSIFRITPTGTGPAIKSITLTSIGGLKIAGAFTTTANFASITPAGGASNAVTITAASAVALGTPWFIVIAANDFTDKGILVTMVDNNGDCMSRTAIPSKAYVAGKMYGTTIPYSADANNDFPIYDEGSLGTFKTRVEGGEDDLNARVMVNFTVSSSWTPIAGYTGTLNGNNKTITGLDAPLFDDLHGTVQNLTLNSNIALTSASQINMGILANHALSPATVSGCVSSGYLTFTPDAALSSDTQIGGLIGNNHGGAISGCTNEATVTMADNSQTNASQISIGGVVGRTQKGGSPSVQGNISDCANSGSVICNAQLSENLYIGGVLGYAVEKAESMSDCGNHGLVKVGSTFSTSKALQLGGVAGMAKGSVEDCSNASDGVVTSEACSVGTYLCQGGVVGRLNGTATYSTLTNAGTLNVAALGGSSARLIGGVVGRCQEGATLDGVTNSGNINYTAEATNETRIGGIVADNTQDDIILENCSSTGGTLTVSNASHSAGLYVGGVVGYSSKAVTNCSNAMTIATSGSMTQGSNSYLCFGGVIGYMSGAVIATSCTNSGAINYGQTVTDEGQSYIGGVVGAMTGAEIYGGGNSGTITFSGQNTKRPISLGGIVGRVFSNTTTSGYSLNNNVTNTGSIVADSDVSGSQYMYAGGLVGQHLGGNIYGTNNAPITVTELHESMMALGGIVGYLAGGEVSNGTNTANGDIAVNGYIAGYHSYVGGIVGMASGGSSIAAGGGTITGASNAGDVTVAAGCTIPRNNYVGGIIGYAGNDVSNASNTGNVVNNYSQGSGSNGTSYHMNIAGVAAHSVATLTSCTNTGDVTNNGSTYKSEINVAGVVGISQGDIISCSNGTNSLAGGTITNTATSGSNTIQDGQFAGVVSNNKGNINVTSCFNKGNVVNSGACSSISIAGIGAWTSAGSTYTECYNTGNITNTGTGSDGTAGVRMGGLVGSVNGASTFTGTSLAYNYNKGVLLENSASTKVAVGGVCGYTFGAASDFAYAKNMAPDGDDVDDIEIKGNTRERVYAGGIIGMSAVTSSFNNTYNEGDVKFTSLAVTQTGQVFGGGIIGGWTAAGDQTINGCENVGWVYTKASAGDLAAADAENLPKYWSCFGGIAGMGASSSSEALNGGWNTITGKTFTNCSSSGTLRIYAALRCCIGGIVAYTENDPVGCVCTAENIRPYLANGIGTVNGNYHRNICGGVVGFFDGSSLTNLKFQGTLNSQSSSPFAYNGGIVGYLYTSEVDLNNCRVGGTIRAAGSGAGRNAVMCNNSSNTVSITFTNCKIKKGTVSYATGSSVTINNNDGVTAAQCMGGGASNYTIVGDVLPTVADSI